MNGRASPNRRYAVAVGQTQAQCNNLQARHSVESNCVSIRSRGSLASSNNVHRLSLPSASARGKKNSIFYPSVVDMHTHETSTNAAIRRSMPRFLILHYSPFKAVWDWVLTVLIMYSAIVTPYMTAYQLEEDKLRMIKLQNAHERQKNVGRNVAETDLSPLVVIDLLLDLIFVADIFISFRCTFMKNGEVVTNPTIIAINYVKGWFLLDVLAAVPLDLLFYGSGSGRPESMTIISALKLMRMIRLVRVFKRLNQFSEYGAAVLLFLMSTFTLVAHWLACLYYAIALIEKPYLEKQICWLDRLAEQLRLPRNSTLDSGTKYLTALYFTFTTLTSIGFGNVSANTDDEKIFTIFGMLIGSLLSAVIFGNVSSIMLRVYQGTEEYQEHKTSVKEFIKFHHIPKHLAKRLAEYWQETWSNTNGIDMNSVLKSFPDCLQADICLHLNRNLLMKFPAFSKASQGCLRTLCMKFKTVHIPPNNFVIHRGEQIDSIHFIARGHVEILTDDAVMVILGKDDTFGDTKRLHDQYAQSQASNCNNRLDDEECSINHNNRGEKPQCHGAHSAYYVRAVTPCDANKILISDLVETLRLYPEFAKTFLKEFQLTYNIRSGWFAPRKRSGEMDADLVKLVQQKRPKLQTRQFAGHYSKRFRMQEVSFGWVDQEKLEDFGIYLGEDKPDDDKKFETSFNASTFSEEDLKSPVFSPTKMTLAPPMVIAREDSLVIPEVKSSKSEQSAISLIEAQSPGDVAFTQWVSDVETKLNEVQSRLTYLEHTFSFNLSTLLSELKQRSSQTSSLVHVRK